MREDLHSAKLPIVTVQLGRHTDDFENGVEMDKHYDAVREAQRQAAKTIDNLYIVPAIDIGRMSDGLHNSKSANMLLGERIARMALYRIYHKGIDPSAPDLEYAKCIDRNKVELNIIPFVPFLSFLHQYSPSCALRYSYIESYTAL